MIENVAPLRSGCTTLRAMVEIANHTSKEGMLPLKVVVFEGYN